MAMTQVSALCALRCVSQHSNRVAAVCCTSDVMLEAGALHFQTTRGPAPHCSHMLCCSCTRSHPHRSGRHPPAAPQTITPACCPYLF
jgi:hypothetical protein